MAKEGYSLDTKRGESGSAQRRANSQRRLDLALHAWARRWTNVVTTVYRALRILFMLATIVAIVLGGISHEISENIATAAMGWF